MFPTKFAVKGNAGQKKQLIFYEMDNLTDDYKCFKIYGVMRHVERIKHFEDNIAASLHKSI